MVVNDEQIYPLDVIEELKEKIENIKVINASEIATEIGEPRSQNMVMLGTVVKALGF